MLVCRKSHGLHGKPASWLNDGLTLGDRVIAQTGPNQADPSSYASQWCPMSLKLARFSHAHAQVRPPKKRCRRGHQGKVEWSLGGVVDCRCPVVIGHRQGLHAG